MSSSNLISFLTKVTKGSEYMSSSDLIRWFGLAAMGGAVSLVIASLSEVGIFAAGGFSEAITTGAYAYTFYSVLLLVAGVLLPLGLVGLYFRQADVAGPLGLVGFLIAFVGTVLVAGYAWASTFIAPALVTEAPEFLDAGPPPGLIPSFVIFGVGWLLFGIAMLRGRIYPRWAAILLIVGAVIFIFPLPLADIVLAVGVAWLGFHIFKGRDAAEAQRPPRVS